MLPVPAIRSGTRGALAPATPAPRRVELDWLRLGTILAVFLFHTGRFFDPEDWHVKNPVVHPWLVGPELFFVVWAMPLLFVISGGVVALSMRGRSVGQYLRERVLRLLLPLAVGTFTHVMWQVYLERVSHGQFTGSFLEFVPRYFDGLYGLGGNFAWMGLHLWYLELLFVFSVVLLPAFVWLRPGGERSLLQRVGGVLARPGAVFLLAIPIALALMLPNPNSVWGGRFFGGWNACAHACFFSFGFLILSSEEACERIRRQQPIATLIAVGLGVLLGAWFASGPPPAHASAGSLVMLGGMGIVGWSAVLAILGGGIDGLRGVRPAFLARASELVLPFYILHQTVILTIGYPVVRWPLPDVAKWALIAVSSFTVTALLCDIVRREGPLRVLFGMPLRGDRRRRGGER